MPLRAHQKEFGRRFTSTPQGLDRVMLLRYGFNNAQANLMLPMLHRIVHGERLSPTDVAQLSGVFPHAPRGYVQQTAESLYAIKNPVQRAQSFVRAISRSGEGYKLGLDFAGNAVKFLEAESVNKRRMPSDFDAAKKAAALARRVHGSFAERASLDAEERRATINHLVTRADPRFREPDRNTHADRLERGASILHDPRVQRVASLRDTIRAAVESHEAMNYGKEIGRFTEQQGVPSSTHGTIGGEHEGIVMEPSGPTPPSSD